MSQWIGRYELLKELDRGFLGTLWVARFDHEGKSLLALVRALQLQEQFGDEVRELIGEAAWDAMEINAVGVAAPVDVVFEGECVGLVYDFAEAQPLSVLSRLRAVQQISCPLPIALRVLCDLLKAATALATYAAEAGLDQTFGGLSPTSVMVATNGRTTLLDPLIAAIASQDERCREHADRVRYLAPEQFRNETPSASSDVYSAGCILWELLANRRLHVVSPRRIRERVLAGDTLRLDVIARSGDRFDPRLVEVVARAMSVDPAQRYASPAEFEQALLALDQPLADAGAVREFIEGLASSHLRNQRKVTESSTVADLNSLLRADGANARRPRANKQEGSNPLAARIQAARSERLATAKSPTASKAAALSEGRAAPTPFRAVAPGSSAASAAVEPRLHRGTLIGIPAPAGERIKTPLARPAPGARSPATGARSPATGARSPATGARSPATGARSPASKVVPARVAAIGGTASTAARSSAQLSRGVAPPASEESAGGSPPTRAAPELRAFAAVVPQPITAVPPQPSAAMPPQPSAAMPPQPSAAMPPQPSAVASLFRDSMATLVDDAPSAQFAEPARGSKSGFIDDMQRPTDPESVSLEKTSIIEPFNDGDRTEVDVPIAPLREAAPALAAASQNALEPSSELEEDSVGRMAMTSLPQVWGAATSGAARAEETSGAARAEETALSVNARPSAAMRRTAWPAVTWFFAGSTVTLLLVVLVLLGRSESAPAEGALTPTTNPTACAPASPAASTASTRVAAQPSAAVEPRPASSDVATSTNSPHETTTQQERSGETASAPTTSAEPSAPMPVPKRRAVPRPRQSKPKPKPSSRFIPADL